MALGGWMFALGTVFGFVAAGLCRAAKDGDR